MWLLVLLGLTVLAVILIAITSPTDEQLAAQFEAASKPRKEAAPKAPSPPPEQRPPSPPSDEDGEGDGEALDDLGDT